MDLLGSCTVLRMVAVGNKRIVVGIHGLASLFIDSCFYYTIIFIIRTVQIMEENREKAAGLLKVSGLFRRDQGQERP